MTTMRSNRRLPALAAAFMALAHLGMSTAQEAEDFGFGEIVNVQLVNVEVWVTDRNGNPVKGLTVDDFELLEDGEPVAIGYFAEVQENRPVGLSIDRALQPEPAAAPRVPDVQPSHLIIYFDQLHLRPANRNRAIEDLREFLVTEKVPPERVLILNQAESLQAEASFGSSWTELDEALSRVAKSSPIGVRVATEKRLAIRDLQREWELALEITAAAAGVTGAPTAEGACAFFLPRAVRDIQAFARESRQRIAVTVDHLANAASFLTGVPGVKTLLFVSDALERAPGADLVAFARNLCPTQESVSLLLLAEELGRGLEQLTRHANANRVTIYSLQTAGLQSGLSAGADQRSIDFRGAADFDLAVRNNERDGMSLLAAETGGRAVFNRNDFDAELDRIAEEMTSYYSLAYEPPHGGDLREHEIEVRLASKNLKARHRQGYRDKSADARMTERLQAAVYLGLVDNPLGIRLAAGTLTAAGEARVSLPLHVLVPSDRIAFLPTDEHSVAQLSLQVSTRNTRTQKGIFEQRMFRVRQPADPRQELVSLVVDLEVPEGVHLVAVGLRDDATLETAFVSTTLELNAKVR